MNLKTLFVYGPALVLAITFVTFVLRSRARVRVQAIWASVLLACFAKFFLYRELGGDAFTPEMPERVIWFWNWAYSGACILCLLSVVTVPFRLSCRIWLLPVLAWGLSAWGLANGIMPPSVRTVTLECPDLPPSLEGYRILQLTDLHVSSAARRWRTSSIVAAANASGADLMVITGDIVDGYPSERLGDVAPLAKLSAPDGVWAVTGNHERYFDFNLWRGFYDRWGIRFLDDECVFPHAGLALGGTFDRSAHSIVAPESNASELFAAATNGEYRVLLRHRPSGARELAAGHRVNLQLSGHTHGGVMPVMSALVARHNGGFVRGLYETGDRPGSSRLYVSPGAGQWAGFPIRFFNPTELTLFVLKGGAK